jgi:nitroreductase
MRLVLQRRSVRKYQSTPATDEQVDYIERCVDEFQRRMGFVAPRIVILPRGEEFSAVLSGATGGVVGKINPWLPFTKAGHLILCGAVYPDSSAKGIEGAIAQAAMTMHVAILAATEMELGTCWMAGIRHERVEMAYTMPDDAKLVAISTLGNRPEKMRLSWDAMGYHIVSKRRKPLQKLWMQEGWVR